MQGFQADQGLSDDYPQEQVLIVRLFNTTFADLGFWTSGLGLEFCGLVLSTWFWS